MMKLIRTLFQVFANTPPKATQLLAGMERTRRNKLVEPDLPAIAALKALQAGGREYRGLLALGSLYLIFSAFFLYYIVLPNPEFPEPPPDSIRSFEPADVETLNRRGYYTDLSRSDVLIHYQNQLDDSYFLKVFPPLYRLNYPPEEAQVLIRDQTRSTFLEEIVRPFRESFYINGFEPGRPQDIIEIDGKVWRQKVIVKYVGSNPISRFFVTTAALILFWFIVNKWFTELKELVFVKNKQKK